MFVSYIIPELLSSLLLACCWLFFIFHNLSLAPVHFLAPNNLGLALTQPMQRIEITSYPLPKWPSVPGCILFGSIPGRHRLTRDPTPLNLIRDWISAQV